jgi:hypothetical protein
MSDSEKKKFLIGLGAQKSGTTWLHHYLASDPSANLGRHKEYRIWDAVDLPLFRRYKISPHPVSVIKNPLRFLMQRFPGVYFSYFSQLLAHSDVVVTADISPSYAGLSSVRLAMIKEGFERRGIQCHAVFLMREPVERCASLVGMWRTRVGRGESPPDERFLDLHRYSNTEHAQMLTGYEYTLSQIERVFGRHEVYFGLYEEMFSDERIAAVSSFCGVKPNPAKRNARLNASAEPLSVCAEDFGKLARLYRSAYEAVAERLPQAVQLWKGFRYL